MADLKQRLAQDRANRDAARTLVTHDVDFLKDGVREKGFGLRMLDFGRDNARIATDGARDLAQNNRGIVAGGLALALAGVAAWIYRKPIMEAGRSLLADMQAETEKLLGEPDESANIANTDTNFDGAPK
ncbi:hypothetical protein GCM10009127_19370 [Alteraurantiacibacter aestuarii]|uniref:hypothetical protein n=1 Tax=Alteraurantiacibacter aestuarii TaxID=650004 RepID=UPI0031DE8ED3